MKTITTSVVVFLLVALGFGGYTYWMQGRLTDMANQKTAVESELATTQAELQASQTELETASQTLAEKQAQTDMEAQNAETFMSFLSALKLADIQTPLVSSTGSLTATGTLTAS